MQGILRVLAKHAVLRLVRRLVHRVGVGIIEFVEEPDEFGAVTLDAEVVNVKVVALLRDRYECHACSDLVKMGSCTFAGEKGSGPFSPVGGAPSRALKGDAKAIAGGAGRPRLSRPQPRKQQAHDIPSPAGLPGIRACARGSAESRADAHPRLVPDAESLAPLALATQRRRPV